ncbi:CDGSH iron-sulfur domain-containing protein, putative [Plasmodium ovale]|uniref:CDGSH iron-sulfur domain-containing protein, putative n=1 Tax=Plasmodium ovale TaxID=36330 RepID=A0A1C3KH19_PLAOA|nr:CDGSH iron-sulfur domain-containing protein, putative [Plasmodium ovale]
MKDPLEYLDKINFNTNRFPQYTHLMESCPSEHEKEKVIRICRCWQSAKFPYCDDTHKVFIENGDNVGPYVAKLVSYKLSDEEKLKKQKYNEKYIKINNTLTSNKNSAVNMKFGYKPLVNYKPCLINKFKKSIFLSFVVLSSVLLYEKKEKLISIYSAS